MELVNPVAKACTFKYDPLLGQKPYAMKKALPSALIILINTVPLKLVVLKAIEITINTDASVPSIFNVI